VVKYVRKQTKLASDNDISRIRNLRLDNGVTGLDKVQIHYTIFPVTSPQQVGSFHVYGEVTGKQTCVMDFGQYRIRGVQSAKLRVAKTRKPNNNNIKTCKLADSDLQYQFNVRCCFKISIPVYFSEYLVWCSVGYILSLKHCDHYVG